MRKHSLSTRLGTLAVVALAAALATPAAAQELRGRITGVVSDDTGAVLPGVTVTAEGPALIQPQTTTTGADGSYRFPALPSGVYTVTYELPGFQTLKREGLRVVLATTINVDVRLQVATVQETVTITGESPTVDVKTTTIGTNFTKELLQDIPNSRDIWAALSQAPGFQMTGYDVGGSHTGTQTGFMTYGLQGQNKTLLEGINVTEGQDTNAGYFDFGSFEELQVGGAGNLGEMAGPGAFLNITIKSGGDRFGWQVYYDYEDKNTVSDNILQEFNTPGGIGPKGFKAPSLRDPASGQLLGLQSGNPILKQYDFNVGGGGPIVKGRAWFWAGYRDNNQYRTILGLPGEESQSQLLNKTVKGTYQLTRSNQVIYFYNERSKLQPLRDLSLARPVEAAHYQDSKNRPQKIEWTSVISSRLFLDAQYSHWGNFFPLYPTQTKAQSTEGVPVGRRELTTDQASGAWSLYHYRTTLKPQGAASLSYYLDDLAGTHGFKFGFEALRERRKFLRFQPGDIYYWDRNGVPAEVDIYNTPNESIDDSKNLAIYAQDGWSLTRRFTINAGVRYDRYVLGWPEHGYKPAQTAFFQPVTTPATTVAEFNSVSPRVGFAWDVLGDGKTVVKAFFGRFYFNPSTEISTLQNPVSQSARRHVFNDLNGNRILDGPAELGNFLRSVGGGGSVRVDPDLEHAYGQELSTHIERELAENLSVRASYVMKQTRNVWAEVDVRRVNAYDIPFTFVDVGPDNVRGTSDDQTLNLFDRQRTATEERLYTNPGRINGVPAFEGDYHTVEFAINRRFKDKWLLLTSFEQSWADDFRNVTVGTGNLDVARPNTNFRWRPNERRFGKQPTTFWNYKLLGRYVFPYDLGVSASYKLQSGFNWARTISVALPNAGTETIHAEPVDANRTENVHILDFRFEKSVRVGPRLGSVTGMVDIFNITNANPITNFRILTGARFREVIALLDPRIVRVGVRWDF